MKIKVFSLFPELILNFFHSSIFKNSLKKNLWSLELIDIRKYSENQRIVDDTPYGGGPGMLLKAQPIANAIDQNIKNPYNSKIIYPSPKGLTFNQRRSEYFANNFNEISLICGKYEGIDQRLIEEYNMEEVSLGDYVVSGGEMPTIIIIDAIIRNLNGVLGTKESLREETFGNNYNSQFSNLLEYPQYTKPRNWRNRTVPKILLTGHHENIKKWRLQKSKEITSKKRPDLLNH